MAKKKSFWENVGKGLNDFSDGMRKTSEALSQTNIALSFITYFRELDVSSADINDVAMELEYKANQYGEGGIELVLEKIEGQLKYSSGDERKFWMQLSNHFNRLR